MVAPGLTPKSTSRAHWDGEYDGLMQRARETAPRTNMARVIFELATYESVWEQRTYMLYEFRA